MNLATHTKLTYLRAKQIFTKRDILMSPARAVTQGSRWLSATSATGGLESTESCIFSIAVFAVWQFLVLQR
jgi:hypothetical protein